MISFKEINGDLIKLAKTGEFDLIVHGCNCFCTMGSGIAKQIKEEFPRAFHADSKTIRGDITKLGNYTFADEDVPKGGYIMGENEWVKCRIVNCYTQYAFGTEKIQLDYEALKLCLRKINWEYRGKHIGLPEIGCKLAGGDWNIVREIIVTELKDMEVTIVHYKS